MKKKKRRQKPRKSKWEKEIIEAITADEERVKTLTRLLIETNRQYTADNPEVELIDVLMAAHSFDISCVSYVEKVTGGTGLFMQMSKDTFYESITRLRKEQKEKEKEGQIIWRKNDYIH